MKNICIAAVLISLVTWPTVYQGNSQSVSAAFMPPVDARTIKQKNAEKERLFALIDNNLDTVDILIKAKRNSGQRVKIVRIYQKIPVYVQRSTPMTVNVSKPPVDTLESIEYLVVPDSIVEEPPVKTRGFFYRLFHRKKQ